MAIHFFNVKVSVLSRNYDIEGTTLSQTKFFNYEVGVEDGYGIINYTPPVITPPAPNQMPAPDSLIGQVILTCLPYVEETKLPIVIDIPFKHKNKNNIARIEIFKKTDPAEKGKVLKG